MVKDEPAVHNKTRNMEKSNNIDMKSNMIQHMEEHGMPMDFGEEEEAIVGFERKVMSILNKLTGRNLPGLVEEFQSLEIVSAQQLSLCVKLIFEKAVGKPGQAFSCAKICKDMQCKTVQKGGDDLNVRRLIIYVPEGV